MIMSLIGARRNSPPPFAPSLAAPSPTGALPLAPLGPEEAVQMARNLLTAASPRDIAALIRPGRVNPDQALAFLQTLPNTWDLERDIAWLGTYDTLSGSREVVAVRDRPQQPRLMPFVPDDEGLWKIDFDAFCGHCEVPLDQLAETKGQRSIVRTTFTQDHYFNGAFADETVWSCVELAHPDLERTYFAYYRKGSDQERTLDAILDRTENLSVSAAAAATGRRRSPVRVMLELDSTRGSTDGLFEIVSVVADGWVMPKQRLEVVLNQNETAAAP